MLTFNLTPVFQARGVARPLRFLNRLGLTYRVAGRLMKGDMQTLKTHHMEKVCLALRCTPNDLLEWKPAESAPTDHPLHALQRRRRLDILEAIHSLPLEKLDELKEKLEELKK